MKSKPYLPVLLFTTGLLALSTVLMSSCDIQSGNETVRNVSINIAGTYRNDAGIAGRQSGSRTQQITLTQSGDQLYGVDEYNIRWTGNITRAEGTSRAYIILKGQTTAGGEVTITGEVRIDGTTGSMTGLWVEPGYTSGISAEATVAPAPQPTPTPNPTPVPNGNNGGNTENGTNTNDAPTLVITSP